MTARWLAFVALAALTASAENSVPLPDAPQPAVSAKVVSSRPNPLTVGARMHAESSLWAPYAPLRAGQLFPDLSLDRRRSPDLEAGLVEMRWRLGAKRSRIPVLEVGGCDVVSPEQFTRRPTFASEMPATLAARTRRTVTQAVATVVTSGCN